MSREQGECAETPGVKVQQALSINRKAKGQATDQGQPERRKVMIVFYVFIMAMAIITLLGVFVSYFHLH